MIKRNKTSDISTARAYNICIRFLAPRPRSEQEIRRHLTKKDIPGRVIDDTIQRLMETNLVDDAAFARMFVESRERHKPRSKFALGCELRQKGIKDSIIDKSLEDIDEEVSAWHAVQPRLRSWQRLPPDKFKKKLFNYLQYRGFGYGICLTTWNKVMPDPEEQP
ncbi:regulatory protein [Desulfocicer vacuolatum DSM 3385]|uniref:Regulatory protein RecX n=1 Tax=Desulfocicer vacuolatum DSM 3385 TaxID=1121400 RepID=A0A1W2D8Z4_9BACT|nr:regulatory protein RecX [Desulfocicer vacuolatum]SMC93980.1 regulatory protein [Desulfocicer vacuolatum DSM 3385]